MAYQFAYKQRLRAAFTLTNSLKTIGFCGVLILTLLLHPTFSKAQQKPSWLSTGLVGNTVALQPNGSSKEQQIIKESGATWIREEFNWRAIEPQKGSFKWSTFDALIRNATGNKLHVLPLLTGTPSWAGSASFGYPNDFKNYANFVGQVTKRYGPGGIFWKQNPDLDASFAPQWFEIWNEPYVPLFVNNEINPGKYAKLFKAAAIAGKQSNPNAKFLIQADYKDHGSNPKMWVDRMYKAVPKLNKYFDGVAIHPYGEDPTVYTPKSNQVQWQVQRYDLVHKQFISHGAKKKPFWITEIGWSTCKTAKNQCVSETTQAQYLLDLFNIIATKKQRYISHIFPYHLRDGEDPSNREGGFGLVSHWYQYSGHSNQSRVKPAWHALKEINGKSSDNILTARSLPKKRKSKALNRSKERKYK